MPALTPPSSADRDGPFDDPLDDLARVTGFAGPPGGWQEVDLSAADVLAAVPGALLVPISVWRAHGSQDPPDTPIFDGLTPRLAAMLITAYTSPGQTILDLTGDLAVEGAAGAGGRHYLRLDRSLPPPHGHQHESRVAHLLLMHWPLSVGDREPRTGPGPGAAMARWRGMLAENAHTVVVLRPPPSGVYREQARLLIPVLARAGLGFLQHLAVVTADVDPAPDPQVPLARQKVLRPAPLDLLVFVLRPKTPRSRQQRKGSGWEHPDGSRSPSPSNPGVDGHGRDMSP